MKNMIPFMILMLTSIFAIGCATSKSDLPSSKAKALLKDINGNEIGEVLLENARGEVKVSGDFKKLPADSKLGFHIHEKGKCENDFKSAGGHFSPFGLRHGSPGTSSHHGDLGNLTTDEDGTAFYEYKSKQIRMDKHEESVIGRAVIIHSGEDDLVSQPSGDAGKRFACGVIHSI